MKKILTIALICSLLNISAFAAVVPEDFVPESWTLSAAAGAEATLDIENPISQNASFCVKATGVTTETKLSQKVTGLTPSTEYNFTFRAKTENANFFKVTRDAIYTTNVLNGDAETSDCYEKTVTFKTGSAKTEATLMFRIKDGNVWIDDCTLTEVGSDENLLENGGFESGVRLTTPKKPEGFYAVGKNNSVKLMWNKPEDGEFVQIYLGEELAKKVSADETSCVIDGLENGTEYEFTARVTDSWQNESESVSAKATPSESFSGSVIEYGARADDTIDDTPAFERAFSDNDTVIVPKGVYRISTLTVPPGKMLKGMPGAVIKTFADGETLVEMSRNSVIDGISLKNEHTVQRGVKVSWATGVKILNCEAVGFSADGIYNDHGDGMTVDNTAVKNCKNGIESVYASNVSVKNCYVRDSATHGIFFWNNDSGTMVGGNHLYENNTVITAVGGIWGTGAVGVKMYGNKVDNCTDVGLDVEYCNDCEIKNNVASRCRNAGISVFHGSDNVLIESNTVFNNHPDAAASSERAGIWITKISSSVAWDKGNRNIVIRNNKIHNALDSAARRGIYLPVSNNGVAYNYHVTGNKISGNGYAIVLNNSAITTSNFVFSPTGGFNTVAIDSSDNSPYEPVFEKNTASEIASGETASYSNATGALGSYKVEVEILGSATVKAYDKSLGEVIAETSSSVRNASGYGVYTLKFDSSGGKNIVYEITNGSQSAIKVKSIKAYAARLPFVQILSDRYGVEYLNNSYTKFITVLTVNRPGENGAKGTFSIERITNYENINTALYRE